MAATVRKIDQGLPRACTEISFALDYAEHGVVDPYVHTESRSRGRTQLLIIDEADRLKATGLEQVRDYYDRHTMGLILIGTRLAQRMGSLSEPWSTTLRVRAGSMMSLVMNLLVLLRRSGACCMAHWICRPMPRTAGMHDHPFGNDRGRGAG